MVNFDYLYNPAAAKPYFNKNYFVDKKLGFQVIERGTILPYKKTIDGKSTANGWGFGGIVDDKENYIKSSHVVYMVQAKYTPPRINFTLLRNCRLSWHVSQHMGTRHN